MQGGGGAQAAAGRRQQRRCVLGEKTAAGSVAGWVSMGARDSEGHCDCAGAFALEVRESPAKSAAGLGWLGWLGALDPQGASRNFVDWLALYHQTARLRYRYCCCYCCCTTTLARTRSRTSHRPRETIDWRKKSSTGRCWMHVRGRSSRPAHNRSASREEARRRCLARVGAAPLQALRPAEPW